MGALDVLDSVEEKVKGVLLRGLVLEVKVAHSVEVLAVVVGVPDEAGLHGRNHAACLCEALRTERNSLGVLVRIGGHHLHAVRHDKILEVERQGGILVPGEAVKVKLLDVVEADHIVDVESKTLGGQDARLRHKGVNLLRTCLPFYSLLFKRSRTRK